MTATGALALARASHPEPVAGVTLLVTALAYAAGRGPLYTALCGAAVLAGQLFVGWTNDAVDADLDAAQGRTDKPVAAGRLAARTARAAAAVALLLCIPLSLAVGLAAAAVHLAAIAAATIYNAGLKRTPLSVLAYACAFGLVPAFVTLGPPVEHAPAWWASSAAALAGAGAHFTQVLPDIGADRAAGVGGLPQRLGERPSIFAAGLLLAAAAALVVAGAPSPPVWIALAGTLALMLSAGGLALRGWTRPAFRLTLGAAGLVVAALVVGGGRF